MRAKDHAVVAENYDSNNIFARIIAGEIPCHKVYEDAGTLVIMDIMPASRGHCMVLPKSPSRNIYDISERDLAALMITLKKVVLAIKKTLNVDGVTVRQNNEEAGGQEVFHTHFHVMPRYNGVPLHVHDGRKADHAELAELAKLISSAIERPAKHA
ncbi:MAG: HIT family protein [Rhizobiales bacterium]|nr:HIT family protein [Hyphomicrobiales bacterium]